MVRVDGVGVEVGHKGEFEVDEVFEDFISFAGWVEEPGDLLKIFKNGGALVREGGTHPETPTAM